MFLMDEWCKAISLVDCLDYLDVAYMRKSRESGSSHIYRRRMTHRVKNFFTQGRNLPRKYAQYAQIASWEILRIASYWLIPTVSYWLLKWYTFVHRWKRLARRFLACCRTSNHCPWRRTNLGHTTTAHLRKLFYSGARIPMTSCRRSEIPAEARQRSLGSSQVNRHRRMRRSLPDIPPGSRRTGRTYSTSSTAPAKWARKVYTDILSRCCAVVIVAPSTAGLQMMSIYTWISRKVETPPKY